MTTEPLSAQDVAQLLQDHPEFFQEHAELFATLPVPHPHESRAISLGERQILTLRERARELEWRLSELVHSANANENIVERLGNWCRELLGESRADHLPMAIRLGLARHFDLQEVALRWWWDAATPTVGTVPAVDPAPGASAESPPVSADIRTFADSLTAPYCGNDTEFEAAAWLGNKPASLALIALRPAPAARAFGLLVLGSDDAQRFTPEMGTAFLESIGALAGATLRRLGAPQS